MRRPYRSPLTLEAAARLVAVLTRYGGSRTLRDLHRRHRFWSTEELKQAEDAGIIRIEKRRPRTGRPSRVAVLCADGVNKTPSAKLPLRRDVPRTLTNREYYFLLHYACKRGCSFFGGGKYAGSAAHTYRKTYGACRPLTPGSARSAGARLMRQPHMKAAFLLDRRLMSGGRRLHWPEDLHSNGQAWLYLICRLDWKHDRDWPEDVREIIRYAHTFQEAATGLAELEK